MGTLKLTFDFLIIPREEEARGQTPPPRRSMELDSRGHTPEPTSPDRDMMSNSQQSPFPATQESQDGNPFTIDHNPNGSHFFLAPSTNSFPFPHEIILGGNSYPGFSVSGSWGNGDDFNSTTAQAAAGHSAPDILSHWDDHGRSLPSTQAFLQVCLTIQSIILAIFH